MSVHVFPALTGYGGVMPDNIVGFIMLLHWISGKKCEDELL